MIMKQYKRIFSSQTLSERSRRLPGETLITLGAARQYDNATGSQAMRYKMTTLDLSLYTLGLNILCADHADVIHSDLFEAFVYGYMLWHSLRFLAFVLLFQCDEPPKFTFNRQK